MKIEEVEQMRLIFDNMPQFVWIKDQAGRYIVINRKFEKFGLARQIEIIGKTDFDIFPEETAILCEQVDKLAMESKAPQYIDQYYPGKRGMNWFETYVTPIFDGNNQVSGTIGISKKISRRKRLESELQKQKKFLKLLIDTIPDFIFYKDQNGRYLGCNKIFAEKFARLPEEELVGKTDLDFMENQELARSIYLKDQELIALGISQKNEEKFINADKRVIDIETITTPFFYEGKIAGLIGISRNITTRKHLEEEWRQQKEYAELLLDIMPSAVVSVDLNNKITSWNKQAELLTGYQKEEVIGKESSYFIPGHAVNSAWLFNMEPEKSKITTLIAKQGSCRYVKRNSAVIRDKDGNATGKLEVLHDVSKTVRMEAALRESQERYSAIVNYAPQIVMIHRGGIIHFINEAGIRELGYDKEYVIGKHISCFLTPESAEYLTAVGPAMPRQASAYELDFIKESGEILHVLAKGAGVMFEGKRARLVVFIDMTEKKKAERLLQASEAKLRQITENINEIFAIRDKDGIEYISSAFERIVGYPMEKLQGNLAASLSFIYAEDRKRMRKIFLRGAVNLDKGEEAEFRIVRIDGAIRWVWMRSYPIYNEEKKMQQKALTFTDITDRILMEEALRERDRETQRELNLASKVQQDSLPKFFLGEKVKVDKVFMPHQVVSGDLLNYKWFAETEKLCGYVVDVSGHGMATALQTATFKMLLDNRLLRGEKIDAGEFEYINQRMMSYLYEDSFAGLLYFEFDFKKARLTVISAGITLFLAANPSECALIPVSGCYLGIFDKADAGTFTMPFQPGDIFCMMSDGLSDLIEQSQVKRQKGFAEYKNWLEKLAENPAREDDCSGICIEILRENKKNYILTIQDERELEQAQKTIGDFLELNAGKYFCSLDVVINEAINNGMRASGRVRVKIRRVGNLIIIRVKDYGPGFSSDKIMEKFNKLSDADLEAEFEARLLAEGGRGLLIMKMLCDRIVFNKQGNEVLVMKKV